MTGCPIAYADPCSSCPQYGNCAPSEAVQKLNHLQSVVNELRQMVAQLQSREEFRMDN